MSLRSQLVGVQQLKAGDSVGYGGTFTATHDMAVGIVACGYADGYPRHAPTGTPILVDGIRTRTLGRVSMDMLCVDLTNVPAARVGTPVVLWGEGLSADEVAAAAGTVSYELLCALAPRVRSTAGSASSASQATRATGAAGAVRARGGGRVGAGGGVAGAAGDVRGDSARAPLVTCEAAGDESCAGAWRARGGACGAPGGRASECAPH
jgi:hypothetical protein